MNENDLTMDKASDIVRWAEDRVADRRMNIIVLQSNTFNFTVAGIDAAHDMRHTIRVMVAFEVNGREHKKEFLVTEEQLQKEMLLHPVLGDNISLFLEAVQQITVQAIYREIEPSLKQAFMEFEMNVPVP